MTGFIAVVALGLVAILAPVIAPYDPLVPDLRAIGKPPSVDHLLGTDSSGRDVLSRLIYGARISLSVGFVAVSIYLVIGTFLGAIAGYRRGRTDAVIMRITDTVMSFPALIIILAIIPIVGPSILNIMLVIGLLGWPAVARLVRGEFLSLREREFTLAARVVGVPDGNIIARTSCRIRPGRSWSSPASASRTRSSSRPGSAFWASASAHRHRPGGTC
jgi:peptide/nickel transport system permease protein